jgi:hydrocephalus-inducing protein
VGDYKDATFLVKNTGLYRVKFAFVMKKKLFKEMFKVEPSEMELDPNQTKEILVRFIATKELKLKTNQSTTDLTMEILEGKTLELFKPVPINVSFNAVFSKFSILPIKSINFGPIQFNENKTRLLEIKNEGQFEFSYTIFDYNNDDYRKQLQSVQDRERQEKVTL